MTDAHRIAELTVEFFQIAGKSELMSERMVFADTVVHIHFVGRAEADRASCTLFLDRTPIWAELGCTGEAEIEVSGSPETWMDLVMGKNRIPMAILNGDLTYRGPVRKFLRVTPILTNFDYSMWRTTMPAPDSAQTGS